MQATALKKKIWLSSPTMHGDELKYVTEAYETNWMSTVGANINEVERIAAEGGDWPLADQEFHWAIMKASHNEYMRRLYPVINSAVNEIMQISQNRLHMQELALADNRLILDFLMQRDEAGAKNAMSIHMKHLINTLYG